MSAAHHLDPGQVARCADPECRQEVAGAVTARALGVAVHDGSGLCQGCAQRRRRGHDDRIRPRPSITRLTESDVSWMRQAACRGEEPELFFPISEGDTHAARRAKEICADCPVQTTCLVWAVDALTHGIAGGMTAEARRRYRREALARAGAPS